MRILMRNKLLARNKLLPLLTLMLAVSVFLFLWSPAAVFAAAQPEGSETLSVDEVWLAGDTLHVAVTDKDSGESQTLALNLRDYAKPGDEYVTIQAADSGGRMSNAIRFKNPYYAPQTVPGNGSPENGDPDGSSETPAKDSAQAETAMPGYEASESAITDGMNPAGSGNPFTPDGTGTVVDNATGGDGKEFFTVETPDGNVFYLIVDRQRVSDNVYLLNAVTENDLASLAKPGDGKGVSAVEAPKASAPAPTPAAPSEAARPEIAPAPAAAPSPEKSGGNNNGASVAILIAVIAVGGVGYYVKIVRPKQQGDDLDDYDGQEGGEGFDDNEEMNVTDDDDGEDEDE